MAAQYKIFTFSDTSPASASTAASAAVMAGLAQYEWFSVDADLVGATGGTLDVYLQRLVGDPTTSTEWRDWLHFPQLAAAASAIYYSAQTGTTNTITSVGRNTAPVIAVNTFLGGHPGERLRVLYVAGASTSAGAAQLVRVTAWRSAHL
jgi:hypothetical protein